MLKLRFAFGRDLLEWVQSETSGYYKDTSLGKLKAVKIIYFQRVVKT